LQERYAWRVWPAIDLALLQQAASSLVGKQDFGTFGAAPNPKGGTVRTVFSASWRPEEGGYIFEIVADAFLYHMVRRLVSFQVEIGQGRTEVAEIRRFLKDSTSPVQGLAPAQGLVLVKVEYPEGDPE
jgi:tRNA pseudouridine38-40 synthase